MFFDLFQSKTNFQVEQKGVYLEQKQVQRTPVLESSKKGLANQLFSIHWSNRWGRSETWSYYSLICCCCECLAVVLSFHVFRWTNFPDTLTSARHFDFVVASSNPGTGIHAIWCKLCHCVEHVILYFKKKHIKMTNELYMSSVLQLACFERRSVQYTKLIWPSHQKIFFLLWHWHCMGLHVLLMLDSFESFHRMFLHISSFIQKMN